MAIDLHSGESRIVLRLLVKEIKQSVLILRTALETVSNIVVKRIAANDFGETAG
ncbi:MAG: hypothetical protein OXC93_06290 [Rhodospirillaceae bacterium]|nr:hypothetical protein [Rhodospirillaceae bacterium]